jgi:nucleoside-diphosphate-sugar epimerase
MRTVLVTGAAGGIGTRLRKLLKGVYPAGPMERYSPAA